MNYEKGGFGYGHAKQELLNLILTKFNDQRKKYNYLMSNKSEIDKILKQGAEKAVKTADQVISRVRAKLGY